MDNFYNEFNQFKSRNVWINNTLTTKEQILNAKGRSYDNTFTLTENILKLLQRKGILCYRVKPVKVSDFNDELEKRLGILRNALKKSSSFTSVTPIVLAVWSKSIAKSNGP
uniref:Uncharacterized protein n=1 Tax=Rhizophagus irregularis (strain DAOM 181602 / DAOM 197198 / MUCL 43194) TaxID=747089 RepID=U9V5V5_RHIID